MVYFMSIFFVCIILLQLSLFDDCSFHRFCIISLCIYIFYHFSSFLPHHRVSSLCPYFYALKSSFVSLSVSPHCAHTSRHKTLHSGVLIMCSHFSPLCAHTSTHKNPLCAHLCAHLCATAKTHSQHTHTHTNTLTHKHSQKIISFIIIAATLFHSNRIHRSLSIITQCNNNNTLPITLSSSFHLCRIRIHSIPPPAQSEKNTFTISIFYTNYCLCHQFYRCLSCIIPFDNTTSSPNIALIVI